MQAAKTSKHVTTAERATADGTGVTLVFGNPTRVGMAWRTDTGRPAAGQPHARPARVTMDQPCFELLYSNGEPVDSGDYIPHFASRAAALEEVARYTIAKDGFGTPVPHQLATPCAPGVDCAMCDLDEDGYVTHFESPEQALRHVRDSGWKVNDDGTAVCPDCRWNLA
jgi:hypothetical protein